MSLSITWRSNGRPQLRFARGRHGVLGGGGLDQSLWARLATAWRDRQGQRRWKRDLLALDDRLLRDIGVTRAEAERAVRQRPGFWI